MQHGFGYPVGFGEVKPGNNSTTNHSVCLDVLRLGVASRRAIDKWSLNSCLSFMFYNKTNGSKTSDRKTKHEEYLRNGYTPPPPGQKSSRGKLGYIFNERFVCQRAGPPRGEASFCSNCQTGFTAFVNKNSEDKNMITVQYRRKHTGHEPGSNMDTTSRSTLPRFVMEFIQAQVEKRLTWRRYS
ncbi:hypothetical protein BDC45DRAFT_530337 [Circinella umbellata]|nr:hypothetical protein BDC45DRAFT_530337 [Circinella umbellata]